MASGCGDVSVRNCILLLMSRKSWLRRSTSSMCAARCELTKHSDVSYSSKRTPTPPLLPYGTRHGHTVHVHEQNALHIMTSRTIMPMMPVPTMSLATWRTCFPFSSFFLMYTASIIPTRRTTFTCVTSFVYKHCRPIKQVGSDRYRCVFSARMEGLLHASHPLRFLGRLTEDVRVLAQVEFLKAAQKSTL